MENIWDTNVIVLVSLAVGGNVYQPLLRINHVLFNRQKLNL
jgi:hypothetical protein